MFATGWSEHEQVIEMSQNSVQITVGISLEPLANIQNVGAFSENIQRSKLFVAQMIAQDLFKFMQSFDTGDSGTNMVSVPKNIFDRWFQRFQNRFQRDPNFFLKSSD